MKNIKTAFRIWLAILPVAFLNGTIRVYLINPYTGEKAGHIISTVLLSASIFIVVYFFLRKTIQNLSKKDLLVVGLFLVVATMIFEFGLGRTTGKSWEFLLNDYNIFKGRIWTLVLITEFFSPYIIKHIRKK